MISNGVVLKYDARSIQKVDLQKNKQFLKLPFPLGQIDINQNIPSRIFRVNPCTKGARVMFFMFLSKISVRNVELTEGWPYDSCGHGTLDVILCRGGVVAINWWPLVENMHQKGSWKAIICTYQVETKKKHHIYIASLAPRRKHAHRIREFFNPQKFNMTVETPWTVTETQ